MAPRSSLSRVAFVCIVLAVLVMHAKSDDGDVHSPAQAPAPHAPHAPTPAPHGPKAHAPGTHENDHDDDHDDDHAHAPAPHGPHAHAPGPSPHASAPAPGAATFSAVPQLIVTASVGVLSFLF